MTPNPRLLALSAALALLGAILVGCAGFHLDPRRDGVWTLMATAETGIEATSATLTRQGPAPFWVEPEAHLEVAAGDGTSTATAYIRYGTEAGRSATLMERWGERLTWLLMGILGRGAV